MNHLLAIALGGAIGALSRYAVSGWAHQWLGTAFPYGTLVANLTGCYLLGLAAQVSLSTVVLPEPWGVAIRIGFLGAFTTFSTFSYETLRQLESGQWTLGLANIGASVTVGLLAVWGGMQTARWLVGPA